MKRKLNLILIPITIAIFGIMFFQVDWMFKTYNSELSRLKESSIDALNAALNKHNAEQRLADSTYLATNLKKWVDTVKINYINGGDSLHIDLQNKHPQIGFEPGGPFYMRISMPDVPGVSVMSPSFLARKTLQIYINDDKLKNKILGDTLANFFRTYEIDYGQDKFNELFFKQLAHNTRAGAFKADSARILKYFSKLMSEYGGDGLVKDARIYFSSKEGDNMPGVHLERYIRFRQNVLHRYPQKLWIGYYLPHSESWVVQKVIYKAIMSVVLILTLIFSFRYLIKIIKQQKQLADIKDDFIDNLTHEFKTPIATISAAVEGMQKFNALENKERTERYLEISKGELTRLNEMVTKLLNISVYEKNNLTLNLHQVDVIQMVSEVISMEKFRAVKPVKFAVDIAEEVRHLHADPLHFKNVLVNLVDNAVKYSKDSVEISFTGTHDRNQIVLKVKDNGIGIPANQLKNVFDKFYRVPTGDVHNVKGSGLGLSYVRSVIEAHGGTITVNSEINVQTEFIISIPLK